MNFKRILSSLLVVVMLMASFASWAVIGTFAETIANAVVASTPLADVGTAVRGGTSLGFTSMSLLPYEVEEETAVLETEAPELADDTHNFKSDVANQTADFSQSDVWTQLFPWGQNTGGSWYDVTGKGENTVANGAYLLKNYNEMFTQANGKYVFSATIEELADPNRCFMFVRGIRTPIGSGEGQYFGHDGENNHSGCGGIQVSVKDHILQIRIRSWDGKTMTRNDYKVYVNSNKISIADDGETVTIMAGDKAVATVTFSGTRDINGHTSVEKAILTLVNQEKSIEIANAVVAASHKSDFGMAIREHGNYIKFSELSMQGYSTVDVPALTYDAAYTLLASEAGVNNHNNPFFDYKKVDGAAAEAQGWCGFTGNQIVAGGYSIDGSEIVWDEADIYLDESGSADAILQAGNAGANGKRFRIRTADVAEKGTYAIDYFLKLDDGRIVFIGGQNAYIVPPLADKPAIDHNYVSDGLVSMYQGDKDQADWWVDVIGTNDVLLNIKDGTYLSEAGLHLSCNAQYFPQGIVDIMSSNAFTVELVLDDYVGCADPKDYNTLLSNSNPEQFSLFYQYSPDYISFKCCGLPGGAGGGSRPTTPAGAYAILAAEAGVTLTATLDVETGKVALYINGELASEKDGAKAMAMTNFILGSTEANKYWKAMVKNVRFYDRALTADEIAQNYIVDTAPEAGSTVTIPEFNTYASAGIANEYVVTGTITEIVNASYGNMYITDAEGNKLYIYGMYANADMVFNYGCMNPKPVVGDTITVIGAGTTYKDAPQMKNAILLKIGENDYALDLPAFDATIEFTDVENRTEFSADKQVWTMNGITLSNTDSKDLKETYYNPIRLYSDSNVTISYTGMKELYIYCQTEYNAEALAGIAIDGATVTADGCIVKIAFKQVTDSVSFTMPAQVRVAYIGVNEIDSLYNSLGDHYYILDETGYAALYEVTITKDNGIGTITLTGEGDLAGTYNWAFDNTAGFVVESDKNLALVYRPMMGGFALQADGMVNPQSLVTKIPVNPYIENVGNHDLIVEDGYNGDAYFFVAPVDGTYTFAYAEGEANGFPMIEYDTSWGMTSETIDFPYTVHLNAGETFILRMGTYDTNPDTINIVISVVYDIDPEDAFYNNLGNDVYYILDETGYAALYEVKFDKEAATVELVGEGDLAGIYNWTYTTAGGFVVESDKEIFIDIIDGTMTLQAIGLVNAAELVTKIPERIVVSDGANVVAATGTGVEVFFTAEKDGTYVISWATGEINGVALIANAEGIYEETALPYEVILLAGETYTFVVATADFSEDEIVVNVAAKSGSGDILDDDDGKGCFGVIGSGALVAVLALVPAAFVLRRKNDEE